MSFREQLREWFTPPKPTSKPEPRYSFSDWVNDAMTFQGQSYGLQGTTYGKNSVEPMDGHFSSYVAGGLKSDGVVSAITLTRLQVFSQARFLFQRLVNGRPGDLFGMADLRLLEQPWPGGTTADLLAKMELHASFAGNFYATRVRDELVVLRPDWVEILLAPRLTAGGDQLGYQRVGYAYYEGGKQGNDEPVVLLPSEVCHYAPYPDPEANHRGMSWLTPVAREVQADRLATEHKAKFFENAATPNLHVKHPQMLNKDQFDKFVDIMEENHAGAANAYRTLYTHGGADVTVIGRDMQQMDFKATQGAGETRLAAAAGVHPVIVGLSEGMQGSSLNAGNYQAAKRVFVDRTMRHLWQNAAGSLQNIVAAPSGARLWYDSRDIPFLREDEQDRANVQQTHAVTIRNLVDAGYEPSSVVAAVANEDMTLLQHSGLFSVQLQPAGSDMSEPDDDDAARAATPTVVFSDGAFRNEYHAPPIENNVDAQTVISEGAIGVSVETPEVRVDARPEFSEDSIRVEVDARSEAPQVTVNMPEQKPSRRRVETDDRGRITAVVDEQIEQH